MHKQCMCRDSVQSRIALRSHRHQRVCTQTGVWLSTLLTLVVNYFTAARPAVKGQVDHTHQLHQASRPVVMNHLRPTRPT